MLILTDGVKTIYGTKITIGTGLNLEESADGLPILHFGDSTGHGTSLGNSKATSHESITLNATAGAGLRLRALPAGYTVWEPRQGERFDVTAYTQARPVVVVEEAANEGSGVVVRFSMDGSNYDPIGATLDAVAPLHLVGTIAGDWVAMRDTCIGDVWLKWGTFGGDGAASPKVGNVYIQFRNEGTREVAVVPLPTALFYEDFADYADTPALLAELTGTDGKYAGGTTEVYGGAELDTTTIYEGHPTMKLLGTRDGFNDRYLVAPSKNFAADVSDVWFKTAIRFDPAFLGDGTYDWGAYNVGMPVLEGAPVPPVMQVNIDSDFEPVVPNLGWHIGLFGQSNRYLLDATVPYEDEYGLYTSGFEAGAGAVTAADLRDGEWREAVCRLTVVSSKYVQCKIWMNGATGDPTATQFYDFTVDDGGANQSSMSLLRNVSVAVNVAYNQYPGAPITPIWIGLVAAYDASENPDPFGVLDPAPPTPPATGPDGVVGPDAAFNPTTGVVLNPGDNIQSAVSANPAGTTFRLTPGIYANQSVTPKDGNVFWGEAGAVLDGGGVTQKAFFSTADNVSIKNLVVRNYVPPVSDGAIRGDWTASTGWVMEHLEVSGCLGAGIYMSHNSRVSYCNIHHNGQIGLLGWAEDSILEHSEIAYNNTNGNDPNGEAGGMKFFYAANLIVRNNKVHHNTGPGVWIDIYNYNVTVENNKVEDNSHSGIFYEISYAGIIRNNEVRRNGGTTPSFTRAGIYISSSPDCEVYGNTVDDNASGIIGQVASRARSSDPTFDRGPVVTTNLYVHDNTVNLTRGTSGLVDQLGDGTIFGAGANNRFQNNHYTVNGIAKPFSGNGGSKSWADWQAAGYDTTGSLT